MRSEHNLQEHIPDPTNEQLATKRKLPQEDLIRQALSQLTGVLQANCAAMISFQLFNGREASLRMNFE